MTQPAIHAIMADFPKTPIGKIQKDVLKEPCREKRTKKI